MFDKKLKLGTLQGKVNLSLMILYDWAPVGRKKKLFDRIIEKI